MLYVEVCMLHVEVCMLHVEFCMLHVEVHMLNIEFRMLHVEVCMLHVEVFMLRSCLLDNVAPVLSSCSLSFFRIVRFIQTLVTSPCSYRIGKGEG
jgi:hypothetical protein